MVKSELIVALSNRFSDLPPQVADMIVTLAFDAMSGALSEGEHIEIRGFGSFKVKRQNARWARNPRTGDEVFQSARNTIQFKAGKEVQERIRTEP